MLAEPEVFPDEASSPCFVIPWSLQEGSIVQDFGGQARYDEGVAGSSRRAQFGHRRITVDNLARVRHRQIIGQPNAGTSRYGDILIRLGLLPNVDPVLAVVVPGNLHTVQSGRLADLRQHLGLDLFRVVRLGLFTAAASSLFVGVFLIFSIISSG